MTALLLPKPIEIRTDRKWISKSWAFLWLIRFVPSSVASLAVIAGFRLSSQGSIRTEVVGMAVGSTFLVTSGCSAWNDYCDRNVDAINLPYRPLPSGILTSKLAVGYAVGAFLSSNIVASGLGHTGQVFYALATLASLVYSPLIKELPCVKNLYVAIYCASLLMFGGYLGGGLSATIVPAMITVTCLTARELLMDIHDVEGDGRIKYQTVPLMFGINCSRWAVAILLGLSGVLQMWLISDLIGNYLAMAGLLLSLGCSCGVATNLIRKRDFSVPQMLTQIRILMIGIILGVLALLL
jgi:4-hydroxybenzoate polyprenyltransferase